jgi:hypothetical protein
MALAVVVVMFSVDDRKKLATRWGILAGRKGPLFIKRGGSIAGKGKPYE